MKIVIPFRKVIGFVENLRILHCERNSWSSGLCSGACARLNSFGRAGNNEDVRLQKSITFFPIGNSAMEQELRI
jgi:hypothetical protein